MERSLSGLVTHTLMIQHTSWSQGDRSTRWNETHRVCLFLVVIAAGVGGIGQTQMEGQKRWTLEGVSVQGTSRISLSTFTVRTQARTARLRQQQRDRQTDRGVGAGVPRHAWPLASRGNSGDKKTDNGGRGPPTLKQGAGPAVS